MQEIPNEFMRNIGEEWEPQDSLLLQNIIKMMEYAYQVLPNFPKSEKFAMAADIKRVMDTMMELTISADNRHYKKNTLQELDVANKKLKKYLMIAYRLRFISSRQYRIWTEKTTEIGKMIGGRIEAAR